MHLPCYFISTDDKLLMHDDAGIATLLDLDGQIIDQGNGFWIKIEAWRVLGRATFRTVCVIR